MLVSRTNFLFILQRLISRLVAFLFKTLGNLLHNQQLLWIREISAGRIIIQDFVLDIDVGAVDKAHLDILQQLGKHVLKRDRVLEAILSLYILHEYLGLEDTTQLGQCFNVIDMDYSWT